MDFPNSFSFVHDLIEKDLLLNVENEI
jgi:hypothetical protein